jgi:DedD protein
MFKQKSDSPSAHAAPTAGDAVQRARTRARQRLIGAVVLLAIGIIGFPLIFETQPRPIPVDLPIEIPRKETMPPLVAPTLADAPSPGAALPEAQARSASGTPASPKAPRPGEEMITESRSDAGREIAPSPVGAVTHAASQVAATTISPALAPTSTPPVMAAASAERERRVAAAAPASVAKPETAIASSADGDRARALLEGRPVASAEAQRFVVQVGAFADASAARETRLKVEKLGLKTYTQVAQTAAGSRIRVRVGPFASRDEAESAMAKAKTAGLDAVVLTL